MSCGDSFEKQKREELKDFATFVDEVYLPFARENHVDSDHDEFRCQVLKNSFMGRRLDQITMMMVVDFINTRLKSETVRKEVLEDGTKVNRKRSPTTVRKEVTLLSSIFIAAMREGVWRSVILASIFPSQSALRYPRGANGTGI